MTTWFRGGMHSYILQMAKRHRSTRAEVLRDAVECMLGVREGSMFEWPAWTTDDWVAGDDAYSGGGIGSSCRKSTVDALAEVMRGHKNRSAAIREALALMSGRKTTPYFDWPVQPAQPMQRKSVAHGGSSRGTGTTTCVTVAVPNPVYDYVMAVVNHNNTSRSEALRDAIECMLGARQSPTLEWLGLPTETSAAMRGDGGVFSTSLRASTLQTLDGIGDCRSPLIREALALMGGLKSEATFKWPVTAVPTATC